MSTGKILNLACKSLGISIWLLPGLFATTALAAAPAKPAGASSLCKTINGVISCESKDLRSVVAPEHASTSHFHPGHWIKGGISQNDPMPQFVFDRIKDTVFVGHKQDYLWRYLEPSEGQYDFSIIRSDLEKLKALGKRLFIGVATKSSTNPGTPDYMWLDPKYGGDPRFYGAFQAGTDQWKICYWCPEVRKKLNLLFEALGREFNDEPYFEGISLTETSQNVSLAKDAGYSAEGMEAGFKEIALSARKAFPNKTVIQMINYAPYDLQAFASWLTQNKIGIGGPDIHLFKEELLDTTYPLYLKYHDVVPTAPEVQWDNYERNTLKAGDLNIAETILEGAIIQLNPWYIFWVAREPYFTENVIPTLDKHGQLPSAQQFYETK